MQPASWGPGSPGGDAAGPKTREEATFLLESEGRAPECRLSQSGKKTGALGLPIQILTAQNTPRTHPASHLTECLGPQAQPR